jgi:AcrR family transcriptional regulator
MGRKSLAEERRPQILEAFYRCLTEKGIEGCTFANIAREANLTTSLINHYFSNKEELSQELILQILKMHEELFFKPIEAIEDPRERLEKLLEIYFSDEFPSQDYTKAYIAVAYWATINESILEAMRKAYERYYGALRDTLLGADSSGSLTEAEAEKIAIAISALTDGLWAHWYMFPDRAHPSIGMDMVRTYLDAVLSGGKRGKTSRR